MKKTFVAAACILLAVTSCQQQKTTTLERTFERYAPVSINPTDAELASFSEHQKEMIDIYKIAGSIADSIYWDQYLGKDLRSRIFSLPEGTEKDYAMINYGPWDRIDGSAFISGFGEKPAGANFYPADMTDGEFQSLGDSLKYSPYTMITRDSEGKLKTVWFHDAFSKQIDRLENSLKTAVSISHNASTKDYLLKKIDALRSDNYYESDLAWVNMTDNTVDLIIGPDECTDDALYGLKNSYEAYVIMKDDAHTEHIRKGIQSLDELQSMLPTKDEYKNSFNPGNESNIYVGNAIYYGGRANAGIKVIALNLPFSPKVQAEKGTKTILMYNLISEKYNKILSPAASIIIDVDQRGYVDNEAFLWNIVFREVSHGLGVKETVNGKGSVTKALGNTAETIEEAKGSVLGAWLACQMHKEHRLSLLTSRENPLTTYLANLVRSCRFGNEESLGRSNVLIYNYLKEKGAYVRNPSNVSVIDFDKMEDAMKELSGKLLEIQATGDHDAAQALIDGYSTIGDDLKAAFGDLRLENIPIDIRFVK